MVDMRDLDLNPHWDRVSDAYADARIEEKLAQLERDRPVEGFRNVNRALKDAGVPAALRLHYIATTAHLGRLGRNGQVAWNRVAGTDPEHAGRNPWHPGKP